MGAMDIIVAFILWSLFRMLVLGRAIHWRRVNAHVVESTVIRADVGCPSLKLHYRYSNGNDLRDGQDRIPCASLFDAERFARRWSKDEVVIVRVNPFNGTDTHFFRMDQK